MCDEEHSDTMPDREQSQLSEVDCARWVDEMVRERYDKVWENCSGQV